MAVEGVVSILEGLNPRMIEIKLAGFQGGAASSRSKGERPQVMERQT
jgi:flagellar motor component MotA